MSEIIYVKGHIIAQSGYHIGKDFVAFDTVSEEAKDENIIHDDLILTKYNTLLPFYEYHATGDVVAYGNDDDGEILSLISPTDVYKHAIQDLEIIKELLKIENSGSNVQETLYKLCFFNAITTYEYYISSLFVSLVLGEQNIFEKFIHTEKITIEIKEVSDRTYNIYKSIIHYIEYYNYHDTKKLKKLFKKILGVEVTELDTLSYFIEIRNSIAHRNGHPKYSQISGKSQFTRCDVDEAIKKVENIIKMINDKLQSIITNW